ncbi:MAG: arginine--tRNA ligase [Clostridiales bacterium]|nr:arginine--tRNA ligase [Clostridiales bacterium]
MEKLVDQITAVVSEAFEIAGFDPALGKCAQSNRPDLCQYQCNGAMAGAKLYHQPPFQIAQKVTDILSAEPMFEKVEMVRPGFINMDVAPAYLAGLMNEMRSDDRCGVPVTEHPKTIIVDYGGANVAKPLHVGHLRSAIIGEAIKRIARFQGHTVIGDVHLGDWGLQMGQIITELRCRQPELPYFDEAYSGPYPEEPPFTISDLEEIYPCASGKSKSDPAYKEAAQQATAELQAGRPGYRALWQHIINVSVADLKKNYDKLDVHFDLWKGESDAQPYIPAMVERMKADGYAYLSDGALVVDVQEEGDTREIPPCMILKSDGAVQYETTDLATIIQRQQDYHPDRIIYLTDKRQELHFVRTFRCAYKTGLVDKDKTELTFIGFGTMNGKDGKPFKTREGGVLRLEYLLKDVSDAVYAKSKAANPSLTEEELQEIANKVGLAAIKYGDLSNQPSKDYVFDVDRFTAFEGNTGPYIMYTMVRIKSILSRFFAANPDAQPETILPPESKKETDLYLALARFPDAIEDAYTQNAPNRLCHYIYELSNALNAFYVDHNIMKEPDARRQGSWILLVQLVLKVLELSIDLVGFSAPDKM